MLMDHYYSVGNFLLFLVVLIHECTCEVTSLGVTNDDDVYSVTIQMPQAVSTQSDDLLCHTIKLPPHEAYILRFEPHASKDTAHHMMVYGCGRPGSDKPYWSCGEMDDHSDRSVCGDGERQIVWAWAMDANGRSFPNDYLNCANDDSSRKALTRLPLSSHPLEIETGRCQDIPTEHRKYTGFRVGGRSNIHYIVIQLHYADKFADGVVDNSGVTLYMTNKQQRYQAGYYVLYAHGFIPPMTEEFHVESACEFRKNYTIFPLAYRTHSHNLGVVTSGYRVRNNDWTEIGRMSPQLPQTFYDATTDGIQVKQGDILASRCTMKSERNFPTLIGPRHVDEMCNFYIMYYTEYEGSLHIEYCMRDAQTFHWADYLTHSPDTASSTEGIPPFNRHDPYANTSSGAKRNRNSLM